MKAAHARLLTRLYPRAWQARFGAEFEALLEAQPGTPRTAANVMAAAFREHLEPNQGGRINLHPSFVNMTRGPSAFLPLAMSLTALTLVLVHIALYGHAREADEGTTAHLWQILMAGQVPIIAFFAIKWLRQAPRQALSVLALHAAAGLASMAPVFYFNL